MTAIILALDIGGTNIRAATIEPRARQAWRAHRRVPAPPTADRDSDLRMARQLAHDLLGESRPVAIGVSFGGPTDSAAGTVRRSHHVPGWEDTPLAQILTDEFRAPCVIDNDANAAALGEHRFGAGRGCDSMLFVTVSTGVGGGWILGGKAWRGAHGLAGEIGHSVVDINGPLCLCGKRGCVERFASGPYMAADARDQLRAAPPLRSALRDLTAGDLDALTGEHIDAAAQAGDALASEILARGARAVGVGIGNAVNLINPQRVVVGGGVSESGEIWWDALRESARATAIPEVEFEIVPAALGDESPLWGAVALVELVR